MNQSKKRILSLVMVAMLSLSAYALPEADVHNGIFEAHAAASYANQQIEGYAMQVAGIVNRERAANGLAPLKYSDKLSEAALVRAEEIQSVFSHTRPNGTRCFTAVTEAGIQYRSVGENIAYGQRSPEEVMNSWMNSSGHRANILGNYDYIGIGVTYKNGTYYWSQFFAVSDDLTGEVVSIGSQSTTASTTKTTSKVTPSTTKATASTTKATSKATVSTTKPTSKATVSTTKPTSKATVSTTQNGKQNIPEDSAPNYNCGKKAKLKKILMSLLGVTTQK